MSDASPELREMAGGAREPYRELLRRVRDRMAATRAWIEASLQAAADIAAPADVFVRLDDLVAPLAACDRSLRATGYAAIADGRLLDLLRRLTVFGLTLARLDIRQDSARHTER